MSKFDEIRDWVRAYPRREAVTSFIVIVSSFLLYRFLMHKDRFLAVPLREVGAALGGGALGGYVVYALRTRQKHGQAIPDVGAVPYYALLALVFKTTLVIAVLVSIGLLIVFRIENWGGDPNATEQMVMKLVGVAFLVPLSALYIASGWKSSKPGSRAWVGLSWIGAIGLYFWNANYAWRSPMTNPYAGYDQVYSLLCRIPLIPPGIALIPWVIWLMMIWPTAEQEDKIQAST